MVESQAAANFPGRLASAYGFGVLRSDLVGNGWPDVYVANDSNPNYLRNAGSGPREEVGLIWGAGPPGSPSASSPTSLSRARRAQTKPAQRASHYPCARTVTPGAPAPFSS
jgi:hypothetical protein